MGGVGWGEVHFGIQTLIPEQANTLCVPLALLSRSRGESGSKRGNAHGASLHPAGSNFQFLFWLHLLSKRGK